ncbi:hypothetical protein ABIE27_006024 [Paenibacillus sp. 4624]|uniref:hypothetical protein n=1 Tax=Paenibacillus sp. 4624 TaxID=3156453 RepID=UPI003D22F755
MKEEYKKYALELGKIGEKIEQISKKFGEVNRLSATTFEMLKHKKESYSNSFKEYKECKEQMLRMNVPSIVAEEHNDFVNAFDAFIKGTEKKADAIDLDALVTNEALFNEGSEQWKKGTDLAKPITDKIVAKLFAG